jgi:hypothetical protein
MKKEVEKEEKLRRGKKENEKVGRKICLYKGIFYGLNTTVLFASACSRS